ncbi:hypothetical protein V2K79_21290 [Pseudomonas alliivorans]|nr:hypothetical protein [Pseudomonas alliivorans]
MRQHREQGGTPYQQHELPGQPQHQVQQTLSSSGRFEEGGLVDTMSRLAAV